MSHKQSLLSHGLMLSSIFASRGQAGAFSPSEQLWHNVTHNHTYEMTKEKWQEQDMAMKFRKLFEHYRDPNAEPGYSGLESGDHLLRDYLIPRYTTVNPDSAEGCNIQGTCTLLNFDQMKKDTGLSDSELIEKYNIIISIQNLHNYFYNIGQAIKSAFDWIQGNLPVALRDLSYAKEVDAYIQCKDKRLENEKQLWVSLGLTVFSLALTAMTAGVGFPAISGAPWLTGFVSKLSFVEQNALEAEMETAKYAEIMIKRFIQTTNTLNPVQASIIGGALAGYKAKKDHFKGFSTSRSISLEDLQEGITAQLEDFRRYLQDFGNRIILGEDFPAVDGTLAYNITNFIGPGNFVEPFDSAETEALNEMMQTSVFASAVNTIYSAERLYILMTPGKCPEDDKYAGPQDNVVCLPQIPSFVFRVYALPRQQERYKSSIAPLSKPKGWDKFSGTGWNNITQRMIVRSSVAAFLQNNGTNIPVEKDAMAALDLMNDPQTITHWSPERPGTFNLAVCYDPTGKFVSSLDDPKGRQYPCDCGATPVDFQDTSNAGQAYRQAAFFNVMGTMFSADMGEGCAGGKNDRQKCKWDRNSPLVVPEHLARMTKDQAEGLGKDGGPQFRYHDCGQQAGDRKTVGKPWYDSRKC